MGWASNSRFEGLGDQIEMKRLQCAPCAMTWIIPMIVAVLLGCVVSGCSHWPVKDPMQSLRNRIDKVWKAKIAGDCSAIYPLTSQTYRKHVTKEDHLKRCNARIESYSLVKVELSPDATSAKATIKFDIQSMGFLIQNTQIMETYVLENGQWALDQPIASPSPFGQ
jgi:hypothetical protein